MPRGLRLLPCLTVPSGLLACTRHCGLPLGHSCCCIESILGLAPTLQSHQRRLSVDVVLAVVVSRRQLPQLVLVDVLLVLPRHDQRVWFADSMSSPSSPSLLLLGSSSSLSSPRGTPNLTSILRLARPNAGCLGLPHHNGKHNVPTLVCKMPSRRPCPYNSSRGTNDVFIASAHAPNHIPS